MPDTSKKRAIDKIWWPGPIAVMCILLAFAFLGNMPDRRSFHVVRTDSSSYTIFRGDGHIIRCWRRVDEYECWERGRFW